MDSQITRLPESSGPGPVAAGGASSAAARPPWPRWPLAVLAAVASLLVGGGVQHAIDQRNAARDLYRAQVLTTLSRFFDEERRQVVLPPAQRSAVAFGDLADSISADTGVNGSGTLNVSLGSGSAAPPTQVAFSVTVASPYASTTFAVWEVWLTGNGGVSEDRGACVLSSTLLGPGRATTSLNLGGGYAQQPCTRQLWSSHPADPMAPRLGLAGIPQAPA